MFNYYQYIQFFKKLFVLINPIGLIPIFISNVDSIKKSGKKKFNLYINFIMFFVLLFTFLLGEKILKFFDININILQITGGLLISFNSFNVINDYSDNSSKNSKYRKKNVNFIKLLTPISFPLMAGPSSITMLITYGNNCKYFLEYFFFVISIILFCFFCWLFFELVLVLKNYFSNAIIIIFNKIFSVILFTYGIQLILVGIKNFFLL